MFGGGTHFGGGFFEVAPMVESKLFLWSQAAGSQQKPMATGIHSHVASMGRLYIFLHEWLIFMVFM